MSDHQGLPVRGYVSQSDENVEIVNQNKELEELVLRQMDTMASIPEYDQHMISIARTNLQQSFMWLNRAVFQPKRLSDDE